MSTVTITAAGVTEFIDRLTIIGDTLPDRLAAANAVIEDGTQAAIEDLYPGGLSSQWEVTSIVGEAGGTLAEVTAASDNQIVLWYEYGTRPHGIDPVNAEALAFQPSWSDQVEFFDHVNHPGETAHEQGGVLLARMAALAADAWASAIDEFMAAL